MTIYSRVEGLKDLVDVQESSTEPSTRENDDPLQVNDLWLQVGVDPPTWNVWDGAAWKTVGPSGGTASFSRSFLTMGA